MIFDRLDFSGSKRRMDRNGFLHVDDCILTKAVVNEYLGSEIPDYDKYNLDPDKIYRVFRDPKAVAESLDQINGLPILDDHDAYHDATTPQQHKRIGSIGTDAEMVGNEVRNSLTFWNKRDIDAIERGDKVALSMGYDYTPIIEAGTDTSGAYDVRMSDIVWNHLAHVKKGRVDGAMVADSALSESLRKQIEEIRQKILATPHKSGRGNIAIKKLNKKMLDLEYDLQMELLREKQEKGRDAITIDAADIAGMVRRAFDTVFRDEWKTINGAHVDVNGKGRIVKGPEKLKKHDINRVVKETGYSKKEIKSGSAWKSAMKENLENMRDQKMKLQKMISEMGSKYPDLAKKAEGMLTKLTHMITNHEKRLKKGFDAAFQKGSRMIKDALPRNDQEALVMWEKQLKKFSNSLPRIQSKIDILSRELEKTFDPEKRRELHSLESARKNAQYHIRIATESIERIKRSTKDSSLRTGAKDKKIGDKNMTTKKKRTGDAAGEQERDPNAEKAENRVIAGIKALAKEFEDIHTKEGIDPGITDEESATLQKVQDFLDSFANRGRDEMAGSTMSPMDKDCGDTSEEDVEDENENEEDVMDEEPPARSVHGKYEDVEPARAPTGDRAHARRKALDAETIKAEMRREFRLKETALDDVAPLVGSIQKARALDSAADVYRFALKTHGIDAVKGTNIAGLRGMVNMLKKQGAKVGDSAMDSTIADSAIDAVTKTIASSPYGHMI